MTAFIKDAATANTFAEAWIGAWNSHDAELMELDESGHVTRVIANYGA